MKNFKVFPICILLIITCLSKTFAQYNETEKLRKNEILIDIKPLLIFSLTSDFYANFNIDYRRHFNGYALRFGATAASNGCVEQDNSFEKGYHGWEISHMGVKFGFEKYSNKSANGFVQPYYGFELSGRYREDNNYGFGRTFVDSVLTEYNYQNTRFQKGISITPLAGMRFNISPSVSLSAEFAPDMNFYQSRNNITTEYKEGGRYHKKSNSFVFDFNPNNVIGRVWLGFKF